MKTRNHILDIIKLICSAMVVFLHFPFPGKTGYAIFSVARCAVPTFFAVSGYFYYKVSMDRQLMSTKKKILHIFNILLAAEFLSLINLFLNAIGAENFGFMPVISGAINRYRSENWRLISFTPLFNYSAWFLTQLIVSYFCFHCFARFGITKKVKYFLALIFVLGYFFVRTPAIFVVSLPPYTDYFIMFMGLPFFALGYYFKEAVTENTKISERISSLPNWQIIALCSVGVILTLIESHYISFVSLYFGNIIVILSFMLFWTKNAHYAPKSKFLQFISRLGADIPLYVYILHSFIGNDPFFTFYDKVASKLCMIPYIVFKYLYPITVFLISALLSYGIIFAVKKLKSR